MGKERWVDNQEQFYLTEEWATNLNNLLEHPDYKFALKWIKEKDKVLELGCNSGLFVKYLRKEKNCMAFGIDLPKIVEKARCSYLIPADLNKGLFFNERFDVILMFGTIEHLYNDWLVLNKVKYLLEDDGKFIISIPTSENVSKNHLRYYPYAEFLRLMKVAGLTCIEYQKHPNYLSQQPRLYAFERK